LGEPEDGGGQTDTKKGVSSGGTDGIWNITKEAPINNRSFF